MFETFVGFVFQNYGIIGVAVIVFILSAIKYTGFFMRLLGKLSKNPSKTKRQNYIPKDILYAKLSYWLEFKIDNINITDLGRHLIFKDLLKVKFKAIQHKIFTLEERVGFDGWDGSTFYNNLLLCISETDDIYQRNAVVMGIPHIVIAKFNRWRGGTLDFLLKSAELISYSPVYKNNHERMQAIYTVYTAMLEILINEAEKTLTLLNGELAGLEYKGVICG